LAVGEPKKVRRLPSHLEGPGFWPWGHGGRKGPANRMGVVGSGQERVYV